MNKNLQKSFVMLVCLIFISSSLAISAVSKVSVEQVKETSEEVTLYRCSPDGSINPVKVSIELKEGQDFGDAIADRCEELTKKDYEMQSFLDKLVNSSKVNRTLGVFKLVKSKGCGFHFKMKPYLKFTLTKRLFSLIIPKITVQAHIPLIYCKYNDSKAYTIVKPLQRTNNTNATEIMEGNHSVIALRFIGYTSWVGRFSWTPLDRIPRSFSGIALFVGTKAIVPCCE